MYKLALCTFALAVFLPACHSQVILWNRCSTYNIKIVPNLNLTAYGGKWYEYEKYPTYFQNCLGCVTANYELQEKSVKVINKGINVNTQKVTSIEGKATRKDDSGKLRVSFNSFAFLSFLSAPYNVIGTDYVNYAIVWSCVGPFKFLWILVRELDNYENVKDTIDGILADANISRKHIVVTSNDKNVCGYDF